MLSLTSMRLYSTEKLLVGLRRRAAKCRPALFVPAHLEMGERGEEAALFFLRREGFVIVARRWKNAKYRGDVDLIGWERDKLCFIEVKTRGSREGPTAESSVDEQKKKALRRLARAYVTTIEPQAEAVRFDIVSVYLFGDLAELILFRSAFGWS